MADLGVGTMLESSLTTVSSGSVLRAAFKSAHINQFRKNSIKNTNKMNSNTINKNDHNSHSFKPLRKSVYLNILMPSIQNDRHVSEMTIKEIIEKYSNVIKAKEFVDDKNKMEFLGKFKKPSNPEAFELSARPRTKTW